MDSEIKKLQKELKEAREAYYNLTPTLSDQEYDAKIDKLRQLAPQDFEVTTIGATPSAHSIWEKIQHEIPMGSLNKVNEVEDFVEWVVDLENEVNGETKPEELLITYKLDGSSLEVIYDKGNLVRGVTRGDGKIGEDVTYNIIQIPNLPKSVPITSERIHVRGEIMMLKKTFEQYYSNQYANPRNTAAGKVRDKKNKGADCKNLIFVAFTLISETAPDSEEKRFKVLKKMKFEIPPYLVGDQDKVIEWHHRIHENRDQIPYEIDGTVIRLNNIPAQEEIGELNMRPRGQIAWKFDPAMGTTNIKDIKWQVGPTGRITGVAVLEPVHIGGVTITHVSLHNIKIFNQLQLSRGDEVLISRKNDVIPYCEGNLTKGVYV